MKQTLKSGPDVSLRRDPNQSKRSICKKPKSVLIEIFLISCARPRTAQNTQLRIDIAIGKDAVRGKFQLPFLHQHPKHRKELFRLPLKRPLKLHIHISPQNPHGASIRVMKNIPDRVRNHLNSTPTILYIQRAIYSNGIGIDTQLCHRRPFTSDGGIALGQRGKRVEPLSPVQSRRNRYKRTFTPRHSRHRKQSINLLKKSRREHGPFCRNQTS